MLHISPATAVICPMSIPQTQLQVDVGDASLDLLDPYHSTLSQMSDNILDFERIRFGIATASLGMASSHTLVSKFQAMQKAGFRYAELGFGAYMSWVREQVPDL